LTAYARPSIGYQNRPVRTRWQFQRWRLLVRHPRRIHPSIVHKHLSTRPRQTHEIYQRVLADYGSISLRSIQRTLAKLARTGEAIADRNGSNPFWSWRLP